MPAHFDSADTQHRRPLLFLHIPKTAGTSLVSVLAHRFSAEQCLLTADRGTGLSSDVDSFEFVTGHVGYSHRRRFRRDPIVFVVLRDPIERTLSAFHFFQKQRNLVEQWLAQPHPPDLRPQYLRLKELPPTLTLLEFVRQAPDLSKAWLCNVQTRQLVMDPFAVPEGISDAELLATATQNLEQCEVVGLTERLPESMRLLAATLQWPPLGTPPHQNETEGRAPKSSAEAHELELLQALNSLDLSLYATAKQLLEHRLASLEDAGDPVSPDELPQPSANCESFSFADPFLGTGWYRREFDGVDWFCWMGPSATLDLMRPESPCDRIQMRVAHCVDPRVTSGIGLYINGRQVPLTWRSINDQVVIEAPLLSAADSSESRTLQLEWHAAVTVRPRDLDPASMDSRPLSIALAGISFAG